MSVVVRIPINEFLSELRLALAGLKIEINTPMYYESIWLDGDCIASEEEIAAGLILKSKTRQALAGMEIPTQSLWAIGGSEMRFKYKPSLISKLQTGPTPFHPKLVDVVRRHNQSNGLMISGLLDIALRYTFNEIQSMIGMVDRDVSDPSAILDYICKNVDASAKLPHNAMDIDPLVLSETILDVFFTDGRSGWEVLHSSIKDIEYAKLSTTFQSTDGVLWVTVTSVGDIRIDLWEEQNVDISRDYRERCEARVNKGLEDISSRVTGSVGIEVDSAIKDIVSGNADLSDRVDDNARISRTLKANKLHRYIYEAYIAGKLDPVTLVNDLMVDGTDLKLYAKINSILKRMEQLSHVPLTAKGYNIYYRHHRTDEVGLLLSRYNLEDGDHYSQVDDIIEPIYSFEDLTGDLLDVDRNLLYAKHQLEGRIWTDRDVDTTSTPEHLIYFQDKVRELIEYHTDPKLALGMFNPIEAIRNPLAPDNQHTEAFVVLYTALKVKEAINGECEDAGSGSEGFMV